MNQNAMFACRTSCLLARSLPAAPTWQDHHLQLSYR
jgi:hypothetical protein